MNLRTPQNQDVNIRILAIGLACAAGLFGQYHRRFSWQDACFNNPRLPYCNGHDSAVRPTKGGDPKTGTSSGTSSAMDPTVDADGVDWRFAAPSSDALAVLRGSQVSTSPVGHNLIDQLGATEGLSQADVQNVFRG